MADRRVRYILEVDYDGESTILKAADDLREVDDAARQAGDGLGEAEGGFSKVQASVVTMSAGLGLAQQGFETISNVARGAWDALAEGAALQDLEEDFEALAIQAGTTADVLVEQMGDAAGGMMTNAEMMGAASELMLRNLGLTNEEIVEFVGLAGELEWSMDAVTNALNTKSSRALKELGLGIEDVEGRVEHFIELGYEMDQAYTLAILDAGRERIALVGGASETAAGQMEIATNAWADFTDALKTQAVELGINIGLFDGLVEAAANLNLVVDAVEKLQEAQAQGIDVDRYALQLADDPRAAAEVIAALDRELMANGVTWTGWAKITRAALETGVMGFQSFTEEVEAADALMLSFQDRQEQMQGYYNLDDARAQGEAYIAMLEERAAAADRVAEAEGLAQAAAQAWAEYTAEATARGGDYFTQIQEMGPATWDYAAALYAAADAHGAGMGVLGDIAVQEGIITEERRQQIEAAAQEQAIIDSLAGAAESGKISWENYAGAVEHAIEVLGGAYAIDLGPRDMPEMEDRGFREGYQEQLEQVPNEFEPIPIEVELETEAINAAVEEARGMVEGFTSPQEAYEAVMSMNIEDVVAKSGEVKSLIEGIPDQKTLTLDLTVLGMELIRELQALGVI